MKSLTPEDQSGFIRFAWGRSRLPTDQASFTTKMRLDPARSGAVLPVAHTCFFSIELPLYKTEDEMRKGLMLAITYGTTGILQA